MLQWTSCLGEVWCSGTLPPQRRFLKVFIEPFLLHVISDRKSLLFFFSADSRTVMAILGNWTHDSWPCAFAEYNAFEFLWPFLPLIGGYVVSFSWILLIRGEWINIEILLTFLFCYRAQPFGGWSYRQFEAFVMHTQSKALICLTVHVSKWDCRQ